jgi:hypothetical protein
MLALPSLMILLSVILKATFSRWLNVIVGIIYTAIQLAVVAKSGWGFYIALGILEAALTALVVWTAWTWPRNGSLGGQSSAV